MWLGVLLVLLGLVIGVAVGWQVPLVIPQAYGKYLGVAVLAALDSVFGGLRASLEGRFDNAVFLSGFFVNACLAAGLVFLGDRLGVELYTAAVVAFGVRLFQNLAIIRRHFLPRKK
ncbi:small basic family protein [Desulfothermobacter acidiphilus]|uniref:small basic family protein n=1 Tax=Desulfothermobacter acidiphilus TaxID=1938353 RepID=UPI003F8B3C3C